MDEMNFTDLNALQSSMRLFWREVLAGNEVAPFPSTSALLGTFHVHFKMFEVVMHHMWKFLLFLMSDKID